MVQGSGFRVQGSREVLGVVGFSGLRIHVRVS